MNELQIKNELNEIIREYDIDPKDQDELILKYLHLLSSIKTLTKAIEMDFDAQAEAYEEESKVGLNRTGDE